MSLLSDHNFFEVPSGKFEAYIIALYEENVSFNFSFRGIISAENMEYEIVD